MKRRARLAAAIAVAVAFCASGTHPAFAAAESSAAEQLSPAQIAARRQALLQQTLQNPGNLDVAYEYAALSSQVGDYEAAVSWLGQVIWIPALTKITCEVALHGMARIGIW